MLARPDIVKKGDAATLLYRANADLTEATAIKWLARQSPDGPALIQRDATRVSVDGSTTVVSVQLTPAETATTGIWLVEVEAMMGGSPRTFPSDGYLQLKVIDDLS